MSNSQDGDAGRAVRPDEDIQLIGNQLRLTDCRPVPYALHSRREGCRARDCASWEVTVGGGWYPLGRCHDSFSFVAGTIIRCITTNR